MTLYERERATVLRFTARLTLDAAVAADLTAETFALALRSWPRLAGRSEPEQVEAGHNHKIVNPQGQEGVHALMGVAPP